MHDNPIIVVGSGPAGVHAAEELVTRGMFVLMLDGGRSPNVDLPPEPIENFEDVRRTRNDQATWFLGHDQSGIPTSGLTGGLGGGQVSGNRSYIIRDVASILPIFERNCQIIQSLAVGGLGAAWGAACAIPENTELLAMGLDPTALAPHMTNVIKAIGVSGAGSHPDLQPALPTDLHGTLALQRYEKYRKWFESRELSLRQPLSAILSRDLGERRATTLSDMEYWADAGKSVYRPQFTLENLRKHPLFRYEGQRIVRRIVHADRGATVEASTDSNETVRYPCRHVVLAAGAIGSARIALASFSGKTSVPFSAKPHMFTACVHLPSLGKAGPKERISLCQLVMTDDRRREGMRSAAAQLYSYRSLMLFRLLSSQPLPCPEALRLLAALAPGLVIADIRFPAFPQNGKISLLTNGTLEISCSVSDEDKSLRNRSWKRVRQGLWKLRMIPVRNMVLPEGSSSHYAGTLPCSKNESALSTDTNGLLRGLPNVSVADAAVFPMLPSVPHTLTIMANARRIAAAVHARLQ